MPLTRVLAAVFLCAAPAVAADFTAVQPDLFAARGAMSSAWADYDNDGDSDLIVTFEAGGLSLYRNDSGQFLDVSVAAGLGRIGEAEAVKLVEIRSAAWGDYDADGDVDLYVGTRFAGTGPLPPANRSYLYRNDGSHFSDVAARLGVDFPGASVRQASWIDYDNDGDVDLFVADRNGPNKLFNSEDGKFVDVSAETGLDDPRKSVGVCWFDMDQDGDLDAFIANQDGGTDALYRNDGATFTDIAPGLAMDRAGRKATEGGVGCSPGDYDNDGDLDLFVATYGTSLLYRNEGGGKFVEVAAALGAVVTGEMVGASWGDYDNDGRLDLYVAGYSLIDKVYRHDDRLFRNEGSRFANVITTGSSLNAADHGVQWLDYDGDGDLDLSLTDSFTASSRHTLLRNDLAPPGGSLQVMVLDAAGRHTRAGAEVRVYDASGKVLGTRLVGTGDGYNSQSTGPVHFGLGTEASVTLEVTFLTPRGRKTQRLNQVRPAEWGGKPLIVRQDP